MGADPAAVHYGYLALAIVGLVAAHAANNMINDYFDMSEGIDTDEYVRALYAPHPVLWLADQGQSSGTRSSWPTSSTSPSCCS